MGAGSHKVSTLLSKGFTLEDISSFIKNRLMGGDLDKVLHGNPKETYLSNRIPPCRWSEPYKSIWNAHKTYGREYVDRLNKEKEAKKLSANRCYICFKDVFPEDKTTKKYVRDEKGIMVNVGVRHAWHRIPNHNLSEVTGAEYILPIDPDKYHPTEKYFLSLEKAKNYYRDCDGAESHSILEEIERLEKLIN